MRIAGWQREEFGLTVSFFPGTGKDVLRFLVPVLLLEVLVLSFFIPGRTPTLEDHLFQLSMPGFTEELAFRGVLMALLDRAFLCRVRVLGADLARPLRRSSLGFGMVWI